MTFEAGTAPACPKCRKRHLLELPCWAGRYVSQVRVRVLETYGTVCCHCGRPGALSVEHVQPRSFGGTDHVNNLRPAHLLCNVKRGTAPMPGWQPSPLTTEVSSEW